MLFGFDSAGAGDHGDVLSTNDDITGRRRDSNDGVFFFGFAADEFVGLADGNAFRDAGKGLEYAEIDGVFVAGYPDRGAIGSRHRVGLEAEAFDALANGADLLLGGVGLHYDQHSAALLRFA